MKYEELKLMTNDNKWNVGTYLLYRLEQIGLKHIFGVPGDFNLVFFDQVLESNIKLVTTCNELNAGYAADGYARINNIGALAVTYAVGTLSAINAVAGAYAENVPVIVISGSPSTKHHKLSSPLHHTLGDYEIPSKMYKLITAASEILTDPEKAPDQIDNIIKTCYASKKPVYIELPVDIVEAPCREPADFEIPEYIVSDSRLLDEMVDKTANWLMTCENPAILVGLEVSKYGLHDSVKDLIEKTGYPFATMLLDKSVYSEDHPQFIGYYEGAFSIEYVQKRIENSCSLLCLGTMMTDANLGWNTAKLKKEQLIIASRGTLNFLGNYYSPINLKDFVEKLTEKLPSGDPGQFDVKPAQLSYYTCRVSDFSHEKEKRLSIKRFFERMTCYIEENDIVVSDVGTALFGVSQMLMPPGVTFIDQSYYCSIGYSVGAILGASMANKDRRVIAFIGDGAFQMTAQELSTIIREGLNPIIFLINNDGYTIERYIHDGSYNDIQPWKYHLLPEVFGDSNTCEVRTECDLEDALKKAKDYEGVSFIEVHLGKWDSAGALEGLLGKYK